ncbi:MAG: hypothetical protein HJJLKODD_01926 [Phycisphaerae bacterium]|nr:hypothetical protein [Phycisphaerae bacterium]
MYTVRKSALLICSCIFLTGLISTAAAQEPNAPSPAANAKKKYVFGVIAKSEGNPVFQAARQGAMDAAADLSRKYDLEISIDWRTPNQEDAQKQADYVEQLVINGVDGIAISVSDATKANSAINEAVDKGVPVMCFDSDAPDSKRFCYYGIDDVECGRQVMRELAQLLGTQECKIAILAGNQNAPNLQARVRGVREEVQSYPNIQVVDVYYHAETPQDAAAKIEEVQTTNPEIKGWAMVGGWPLFTDTLLKWEPGKVKIVAVDALPAELPYVEQGVAQVLLAQRVYEWGYRSIEIMLDKVHFNKDPQKVRDIMVLDRVTVDNVAEYAKNWDKWLGQQK